VVRRAPAGVLAGAATFAAFDAALDRYVSGKAGPEQREVVASATRSGVGLALLAAVTRNGVPENLAFGGVVGWRGVTVPARRDLFSNLPEALVGAVASRGSGLRPRTVVLTWVACAVLLAAAVMLGRGATSGLTGEVLAVVLAFAGGAVLASLADTLMPEAFGHGQPLNAFATAAGFFLSFVLAA
jgi:ZIP family zinc transporter